MEQVVGPFAPRLAAAGGAGGVVVESRRLLPGWPQQVVDAWVEWVVGNWGRWVAGEWSRCAPAAAWLAAAGAWVRAGVGGAGGRKTGVKIRESV